ncbi:glutathione S-transferase [Nostoc linckia z18]|jgi:glutathione S-transferase|uniref:Glutathione S-transferase n=2 Tax=Nostoc linckia TaxID=92942 RepID=A0A9Q5ZF50_NOSLI|nr:glutathione S-transferase family protein [Nostoc linckia]PHK40105.1 glutathione S-transferase [Nostoc linckia z15]PHK46239.1 glutathione S-transferase [Nostoc linckia z16]PHJ66494.1 glutathione S-transferase [Nostoc linckia z1]PHJ71368.1 glutathione S-transferase [Nostoc linckia z3]PHJ75400.1 glutathione S-transferase [Nostoc linckia z2]
MKLFYTPNSPYARIARVTALELNLGDRIQMQKVTVRDSNSDLLHYNPTGKVPTLATDDGFILSESRIICVYLNQFNPEIKVVADISNGFLQQLEGIAGGFIDGIAVWVRELRRPLTEQSPGVIELERSRALRILNYFEKISEKLDQTPKLAHITIASALGLESRLPQLQWRQNYSKLAQWYDEFSGRPSFQLTKPES